MDKDDLGFGVWSAPIDGRARVLIAKARSIGDAHTIGRALLSSFGGRAHVDYGKIGLPGYYRINADAPVENMP